MAFREGGNRPLASQRKHSIIPGTVSSRHDSHVDGIANESARQLIMRSIDHMHVNIGEASMMFR
jgi:hypothetical protein